MAWSLPDSVSFCETHGQLVFLDSAADLYLSLPEAAEAVFRRLMAGETIFGAPSNIPPELAAAGLLVEGHVGRPLTPCTAREARTSLLEHDPSSPDRRHLPGLAAALIQAALSLRLRGLDRTLRALSHERSSGGPYQATRADPGGIVAAFARLGLVATPHEQCLVRAIALGRYLRRHRYPVDVLLGARLRPFSAHAWVQLDDVVLNDHLDTVRNFTPIRVV